MKGCRKKFHTNSNQKRAEFAIIMSEKDFQSKLVTRVERHIDESVKCQEDIITDIYTPKNKAPKYIKQN